MKESAGSCAELAKRGLADNTVIIFTSDNGEMLGDHGCYGKWIAYEGSIRVPHIRVRSPHSRRGTRAARSEEMVLHLDIAPTLLDLAGLKIPGDFHGRSYRQHLRRSETSRLRDDFFYEFTMDFDGTTTPCEGIRTKDWKYVKYYSADSPNEQLFHLESDPWEQENLIDHPEYAEVVEDLKKRMDCYYALARPQRPRDAHQDFDQQ